MMGNDHDDWEVAVDTGEFDKRLEQLEKDRAATQESIIPSTLSNVNDNRNFSNLNVNQSNKPIRILKRPTNQSQTSAYNDFTNSSTTTSTNNDDNDDLNSPFYDNNNSITTTAPVVSIIPRKQSKESVSNTSSVQTTKSSIKTYEQRELEYRLARLRIMGEEESSIKDDDDSNTRSALESITTSSNQPLPKTNLKTDNIVATINSTECSTSSLLQQ
ncbi:hypothetical protein I4U23_012627 [Adineta vaga]|nr:hypothetical protein I4U23_012627 [Adineta vaga]